MSSDISVVIPAFNAQEWIVSCLNSIQYQTLSPLEIIVVDDASTDNTATLIQELMHTDSRIRYVQLPPKLVPQRRTAMAINTGLNAAKGRFLALMDADDVALPYRLEKQLQWLLHHPHASAVGGWVQVLNGYRHRGRVLRKPQQSTELLEMLPVYSPFYQNTVLMRTEDINRCNLRYNETIEYAEDYEFFSRLTRLLQVGNLQQVLVFYRQHQAQSVRHHSFETCVKKTAIREFVLSYGTSYTQAEEFWAIANHRQQPQDTNYATLTRQADVFFDTLYKLHPQRIPELNKIKHEVVFKRLTTWPRHTPALLWQMFQDIPIQVLLKKKEEALRFAVKCLLFYDHSG